MVENRFGAFFFVNQMCLLARLLMAYKEFKDFVATKARALVFSKVARSQKKPYALLSFRKYQACSCALI